MAKQPPHTHSPQQPEAPDYSKAHPLMRGESQVDNLLAAAAKRKEFKEFQIEELDKWKDAVIGIASSPNGRLFLQSIVQFSGHLEPVDTSTAQSMVERAIKAAFYLKWVRPYLNPELRSTIE